MVNVAAMVWRRVLRKRWVLALLFGLSLVYFLTSTFKQEERAVRDRNLLQVQDHDQPIPWKVQFNLGNSSRPSNQCRNSIQGKHLITDELVSDFSGYVCERKALLVNGCCNVNVPNTKQYCCDGCLSNGCCSAYEYCVSCCLQPNKQLLLERFLNRAAVAFQNLFMAVEDHFELCLAKCRTSSQPSGFCPQDINKRLNLLLSRNQQDLLVLWPPGQGLLLSLGIRGLWCGWRLRPFSASAHQAQCSS
ncbi:SREBP regulating gene protein isoform 1-T3 [Dugong dugon]